MTKRRRTLHVKRIAKLDALIAAASCDLARERRRLRAVVRWAWLVNLAYRKVGA
jgi:hypothetical protein